MQAESIYKELNRVLPGLTLNEFAGMVAHDYWRQTVKRNHPKLFRQVARLLFEFDLEGIYLGGADEYETEAALIILRLRDCRSVLDIQKLVAKVFQGSGFSGELARFEEVALELGRMVHKYKW